MNKLTQAGIELQKALDISDSDADALGVLGMVRVIIGRYHKAEAANRYLREELKSFKDAVGWVDRERIQGEP